MLAEPLAQALAAARAAQRAAGCAATRTIHLSPAGAPLTHAARRGARGGGGATGYVLLAGRYEGIDERLRRARGRRGDRDRRFRRVGRRAAGADADRRGRAAAARRAERRGVGGAGFVRRPGCSIVRITRGRSVSRHGRRRRRVPEVLLSGHHAEIRTLAARSSRWAGRGSGGPDLLRGPGAVEGRSGAARGVRSAGRRSSSSSDSSTMAAWPVRADRRKRAHQGCALRCAPGHRNETETRSMNIIETAGKGRNRPPGQDDSRRSRRATRSSST